MNKKKWFLAIFCGLSFFNMTIYADTSIALASNNPIDGIVLPQAKSVQAFQLIDNHGKPFTEKNLQGHWSFVFFGFTNCPYVCPTTMSEARKMMPVLQHDLKAAQIPQVIFITVDPARDTPERLSNFLSAFDKNFIGLTGSANALQKVAEQFHVVSENMPSADGKNYTIDHSADMIVVNPSGKMVAYLSYPHTAKKTVENYEYLLRNQHA